MWTTNPATHFDVLTFHQLVILALESGSLGGHRVSLATLATLTSSKGSKDWSPSIQVLTGAGGACVDEESRRWSNYSVTTRFLHTAHKDMGASSR